MLTPLDDPDDGSTPRHLDYDEQYDMPACKWCGGTNHSSDDCVFDEDDLDALDFVCDDDYPGDADDD